MGSRKEPSPRETSLFVCLFVCLSVCLFVCLCALLAPPGPNPSCTPGSPGLLAPPGPPGSSWLLLASKSKKTYLQSKQLYLGPLIRCSPRAS